MQEVLSKIGYGLYVLTAKEGEKDNGCIINAVSQITSSSPAMVSIAVNKLNYTHDMILRTSEFNVSMLTEATPFYVFEHFGFQSGKTVNKFENCSTELRTQNGILYLPKFINGVFSGKEIQTDWDYCDHRRHVSLCFRIHGEYLSYDNRRFYRSLL